MSYNVINQYRWLYGLGIVSPGIDKISLNKGVLVVGGAAEHIPTHMFHQLVVKVMLELILLPKVMMELAELQAIQVTLVVEVGEPVQQGRDMVAQPVDQVV